LLQSVPLHCRPSPNLTWQLKKEKSRFIKTAPSTFGLNTEFKKAKQPKIKEKKEEKIYELKNFLSLN